MVGLDTESNYDSKVCLLLVAVFSDTREEVYLLNMGELAVKLKCQTDLATLARLFKDQPNLIKVAFGWGGDCRGIHLLTVLPVKALQVTYDLQTVFTGNIIFEIVLLISHGLNRDRFLGELCRSYRR